MTDKFLFLADFHVKARTWTNNTQIRGDSYEAMKQIGDYAEENELDTLVIGGDFFDSNRPTPDDLVQTVDFISRFKQVYYIRGNHDSCDPSYLESVSRILGINNFVQQLNGQMVHIGKDCYLTGISWMPSKEEYRKAVQDTLDYFKRNHADKRLYIVLHTSFKHLLAFEGAYTFDFDEVVQWCGSMDVTFLVGDVHVRDTRRFNSHVTFHSPGSVYPLQFNETDTPQAVTIVFPEKPINDRIRCVPVLVRRYTSHRYTSMQMLQTWLENTVAIHKRQKFPLPTYARVIIPDSAEFPHIDMSQYPDLVIQLQLEADAARESSDIADTDSGYTLEQAINDEFPDPDVAEIANKLVTSPDPADDLRKYLDFWQVERTTM